MLENYKATIRGNHIEWNGEVPEAVSGNEDIPVIVTIKARDDVLQVRRPLGLAKGDFTVPDDFDSALPDEVLSEFEN